MRRSCGEVSTRPTTAHCRAPFSGISRRRRSSSSPTRSHDLALRSSRSSLSLQPRAIQHVFQANCPEKGEETTRTRPRLPECTRDKLHPELLRTDFEFPEDRKCKGQFSRIMPPRFIDFDELPPFFKKLRGLFAFQGWENVLSTHITHCPDAVLDFYDNLWITDSDQLVSAVGGTKFQVTARLVSAALDIPNLGACLDGMEYSEREMYTAITQETSPEFAQTLKLNSNTFPPMNRVIHHIITTMIFPKQGAREGVRIDDKYLIFAILKKKKVNLAQTILDRIYRTAMNPSMACPYSSFLSKIFLYLGMTFDITYVVRLTSRSAYDAAAMKRMGYEIVRGKTKRTSKTSATGPPQPMDEDINIDAAAEAISSSDSEEILRESSLPYDQEQFFNNHFQNLQLQMKAYIQDQVVVPINQRLDAFHHDIQEIRSRLPAQRPPTPPAED